MMPLLSKRGFFVFWSISGYLWGIVILSLLLISCKSVPIATAFGERDFNQYLYKSFTTEGSRFYSADIELVIKAEETRKVRGKVFVKQGDFIFMSFNFLGIELARAELSPDSIKFINRFDKTYFFGRIDDLNSIVNLDLNYSQIELLILKGLIVDNSDNKRVFKNRIKEIDDGYVYLYEKDFNFQSLYSKDNYELKDIELKYKDTAITLIAKMTNYYRDIHYPGNINVLFSGNDINVEADIFIGKISKERIEGRNFLINNKYRELLF